MINYSLTNLINEIINKHNPEGENYEDKINSLLLEHKDEIVLQEIRGVINFEYKIFSILTQLLNIETFKYDPYVNESFYNPNNYREFYANSFKITKVDNYFNFDNVDFQKYCYMKCYNWDYSYDKSFATNWLNNSLFNLNFNDTNKYSFILDVIQFKFIFNDDLSMFTDLSNNDNEVNFYLVFGLNINFSFNDGYLFKGRDNCNYNYYISTETDLNYLWGRCNNIEFTTTNTSLFYPSTSNHTLYIKKDNHTFTKNEIIPDRDLEENELYYIMCNCNNITKISLQKNN